jgi:hypothetical protein
MNPATHSERERFVADLVRHAPASDATVAGRLMRYSGAFSRLAALDTPTLAEQKKFQRIKGKITKLCEGMGCTPVFAAGLNIVMPDNYAVAVPRI